MRIVRSPKAWADHFDRRHSGYGAAGRLRGVDQCRHRETFADRLPRRQVGGGVREFRQPALAQTYVRYVGDPVAAVFAEDPYVAEDAAELVTIELEGPTVLSAGASTW
jgi:CO/xanthine dehydrogenase Mo-binding subunit